MFHCLPCLCSQSYSYLVNYRIQYELYDWHDKNTDKEDSWLRLPGLGIWTTSCLVTLVSRIFGIVEVFFKGIGISLRHPTQAPNELGLKTIKNILRVFHTVPLFLFGVLWVFGEPKSITLTVLECARVNLKYARLGAIGKEEHVKELGYVNQTAYVQLLDYQKRVLGY